MTPGQVGRDLRKKIAKAQPTPGPEAAEVAELTVEDIMCHWVPMARISWQKPEKPEPTYPPTLQCQAESPAEQNS